MSLSSPSQLPPSTNDDLETEGAHASPAPHPQPDPLVPGGTTLLPGTAPSLALARSLSALPTDALPTISPFDLFTTQVEAPHCAESRVDAMRRLSVVAAAIGPAPTVSALLPYLDAYLAAHVDDEDDEVLLLLADQLGNLVPGLVRGAGALPVLPLLERIAAVEETVVREKAVESLNKIIPCLNYSFGNDDGGSGEDAVMADADGGGEDAEGTSNASPPSPSQTPALLLAMVKRLATAEWFTAKVSAAGILPAIYRYFTALHNARVAAGLVEEGGGETDGDDVVGGTGSGPKPSDAHRELRAIYRDLSSDDAPMVRRSTARHLAAFVEACAALPRTARELSTSPVGPNTANPPPISPAVRRIVLDELIPLYQTLGTDEQDSVRLLAVSASGSVGYALGVDPELTSELVFPVVRGGCQDLSWRVRNHLSREFATVASSLGFASVPQYEAQQVETFRLFSSLLQDNEAEVRSVAVDSVARMAQLGGPDLFQAHITPALPLLADDPVMEVRSKLAHAVMDCCDEATGAILTDRVVLSDFKPLLENFLNDEFAEVQLRVLTKLSRVSHLFARMDTVVGSILAMAKATNWRVRDAVSRLLPHLAEARGIAFFEDHLLELWMKLLQDQVAEVRFGCISGMPKLLSVAGPEWVQKEILPRYLALYEGGSSYMTRITVLRSFSELVHDGGANGHGLLEDVLNCILGGLEDRVANVRMVAAQGLAKIVAEGGRDAGSDALWDAKVQPALSARVAEDEDDDCKFFAQIALDACA